MRGRPCHSAAPEAQDGRGPELQVEEMTETGGKSPSPPRRRRGSAAFGRGARRLQRRGGTLSRVTVVQFPARPAWAR